MPGSVEDEFRGYLACGLLCFGFARALCTGCDTTAKPRRGQTAERKLLGTAK